MNAAPTTALIPRRPMALRAWICYMLRLRGLSLRRMSLADGMSENAYAIALWKPYPRAQAAIGSALGIHPSKIWPERYDSAGAPIKRPKGRPRKKSNALEACAQSKSVANG